MTVLGGHEWQSSGIVVQPNSKFIINFSWLTCHVGIRWLVSWFCCLQGTPLSCHMALLLVVTELHCYPNNAFSFFFFLFNRNEITLIGRNPPQCIRNFYLEFFYGRIHFSNVKIWCIYSIYGVPDAWIS